MQHLIEGHLVYICGYEFVVTNLRIIEMNGLPTARFEGICTADERNDDIRKSGYNGGTYGGNHLVYTWE